MLPELVKKGALDRTKAAEIQKEAEKTGKSEEELIVAKGLMAEEYLYSLKSEILKIPVSRIHPDEVSLDVLILIPEESARNYKMVALKKQGAKVEIGMADPENMGAREALEFLSRQNNFSYVILLITPGDLNAILKKYRSFKKEVSRTLEEIQEEQTGRKKKDETDPGFERIVEDAPISKMVAVILRHAVEGHASDIHIEPVKGKLRVRFRMSGMLYASLSLPLKIHPAIIARIKILSNLKIDETRIPQDGRFSTKIGERDIDFRVSTFPTIMGEKMAIRILDPNRRVSDFKSLGLTGRNFQAIERAIKRPFGMILVTGPTGSGKTTTLYAVLGYLNKEAVNIVTLEDPVEYFMEGVNQSQVKPEIGYEFATGLRSILRQDPNIIMVGEIRDEETASLAIHSALTGHIVLSTLHTNSAIGVIPRLVDMGIKPFLIAPTLSVAIAQRLIRKLCDNCKKKTELDADSRKDVLEEIEKMPETIRETLPKNLQFFAPAGCPKCGNSGYTERIGVFEILEMTEGLSKLIAENTSEAAIWEEAKKQGMITMKQDGVLKMVEGVTSLEEVLRIGAND